MAIEDEGHGVIDDRIGGGDSGVSSSWGCQALGPWFDEGRKLQHLLPWERRKQELRAEIDQYARLRLLRPYCVVDRQGLCAVLNSASRAAGWPPAPGGYTISFDGEVMKIRACGELAVVRAHGAAANCETCTACLGDWIQTRWGSASGKTC